jgi:hypothetical protein
MNNIFIKLHIVIVLAFTFQKMCIKVHDARNINNTLYESDDLENAHY